MLYLYDFFSAGKYHEQRKIDANSVGHGYDKIFGHYIDASLTEVNVEDPYVRNHRQVHCITMITVKPLIFMIFADI